jgi:hypothetical protein
MPGTTLSAAIKEAYASAPANVVIYHTLEFRHTSFTQPIYVVRDFQDLNAVIEPASLVNGGSPVLFVALAFDIKKPEVSSTGLPQVTIELDNVDQSLVKAIEVAIQTTELVQVIYREYCTGHLDLPQNNPPLTLTVTSITATPFRISATATLPNLMNRRFPTTEYNANVFPSLI